MTHERSCAETAVDARLVVVDLLDQLDRLKGSWLWWRGSVQVALETFMEAQLQLRRVGLRCATLSSAPAFPVVPVLMFGARRAQLHATIDVLRAAEAELTRRIDADPAGGMRPMAEGRLTGGLRRSNARIGAMKNPTAGC